MFRSSWLTWITEPKPQVRDLEKDMEIIRQFYAGITGKHPEKQGEVQLRSS